MAFPYITLGSPTTGGGKVITANQSFLIEGKPVACVGDQATCPKHKTTATIVAGDNKMVVMGNQLRSTTLCCLVAVNVSVISP